MSISWVVIVSTIMVALSLCLDTCALSMSLATRMQGRLTIPHYAQMAFWFTAVHVVFLSAGFLVGNVLASFVQDVGPWIACALLSFVGVMMIRDAVKGEEEPSALALIPPMTWKVLLPLACASSMDALSVGSSLALTHASLPLSALILAVVTVVAVLVGARLGNFAGDKAQKYAFIFGGVVLILLGLKSFIA